MSVRTRRGDARRCAWYARAVPGRPTLRALALAAGCVAGCGVPTTHRGFVAALPYSEAPLPAAAKIFLVAGGVDVANFAAEVAAQRRLWLSRGYAADEIACYWAAPTRAAFRADRAQFRRLAAALRPCYAATPALLRAHLAQAARGAPPFVYLYVTSHGLPSLLPENVPKDMLPEPVAALLGQYSLQLGAAPGAGVEAGPLLAAQRAGTPAEDLVLAPDGLARALAGFPAATPKFVVLQGCHAGGFAEALAGVPGLVGLMAARHDRASFGCDPGQDMTFFGAIYGQLFGAALAAAARPQAIDWSGLFAAVEAEVAAAEAGLAVDPSLPVFVRGPEG